MIHRSASGAHAHAEAVGLYVHLPWCAKKCPYCDFNSFELRGALPQRDYIAALLRDLDYESDVIGSRTVASIYIGGGTPSLFSADRIGSLLEGIRAAVDVCGSAEITLEANPGTIEASRFIGFREAGVNRVSIGVQSLRDEQLARLGRVHSSAEARSAVAAALTAGFDSVNLDLMYALPGDSVAEGLEDLECAISLGTPHLSWYQLTLEPNTAWERRSPSGMPDQDVVEPLERAGRDMLAAAGFERYEVSAYAQPGHRCTHNLRYWRFDDYIGIGAGAHSKCRLAGGSGHRRYGKLRNPQTYMKTAGSAACVESSETVSESDTITLEYLMNTLRLVDGTTITDFEAVTGAGMSAIADAWRQGRRRGLFVDVDDRLCVTEQGMNQLNRLLRLLC